MDKLLKALKKIVGTAGYVSGEDVASRPARWGTNIMHQAKALLRPASVEEVSAILALCNKNKQSVITVGGNTGMVGGTVSTENDILLSLERMNKVLEVDALSRTLTVEAGVTLEQAQNEASNIDLMFPIDLGARGSATIGGNIATNAGGNGVIRYGMTRDLVLGLEVVMADGTIINSLNKLIKNNTGYDTKQLFIGAEGTLGIITKAVLKLKPAMPSQSTAFVAVDSFKAVLALLDRIDKEMSGTLSAFEVMWKNFYDFMVTDPNMRAPSFDNPHPYYILLEASGGQTDDDSERFQNVMWALFEERLVTDAVIAQSGQEREVMWAFRDNISHLFTVGNAVGYDISVPQSSMEAYVDRITQELDKKYGDTNLVVFGHVGDGNIHLSLSSKDHEGVNDILYSALKDMKGSISAEHGIGLDKKAYLPNCRTPEELALMQSLKKTMDPNTILNPGKIFGTE